MKTIKRFLTDWLEPIILALLICVVALAVIGAFAFKDFYLFYAR